MTWADKYEFSDEFYALDPESEGAWTAELNRELAPGHPLYGRTWRIIAKFAPQDEVVLTADNEVYQVHLTWVGKPERPGHPGWEIFASAEEFEAAHKYR